MSGGKEMVGRSASFGRPTGKRSLSCVHSSFKTERSRLSPLVLSSTKLCGQGLCLGQSSPPIARATANRRSPFA